MPQLRPALQQGVVYVLHLAIYAVRVPRSNVPVRIPGMNRFVVCDSVSVRYHVTAADDNTVFAQVD